MKENIIEFKAAPAIARDKALHPDRDWETK